MNLFQADYFGLLFCQWIRRRGSRSNSTDKNKTGHYPGLGAPLKNASNTSHPRNGPD